MMVKKEVGAIFAALLLVATLGVAVASASGVVIGGGYNDSSVDTGSSTFSDFFTTNLWNGSFWDYVAEEEEEVAEEVEEAEAEESDSFWLTEGKTPWPAGYWDVNPDFYKRGFSWYDIPGYWDVDWGFEWP